ncbi:unnamed protein product [Durusdinium trenchii]|uniref:Protein kinase domain-containing protein n=1 Tax=Durusdinium trenchii TaxID=1381693 RepID=A0ABP0SQ99_9DINO
MDVDGAMEDKLWLHPRHWTGRSCEAFCGQGRRFEALQQMLKQALAANDAWHPRDSRLLVNLRENELCTACSDIESRRIPLQFTDLVWSYVDRQHSTGKLFEAETEDMEENPKCVFLLAPRWSMMELGTAKGIDVDTEDVWFLNAQLSEDEREYLLGYLGRAGALRWDFNQTYYLTKRVLGSGGFSIVYDGLCKRGTISLPEMLYEEDDSEDEEQLLKSGPSSVALKLLQKIDSSEHATAVINEVYFLSLCGRHPNITSLHGTWLAPQRYKTVWILSMERYSNGRLSDYIDMHGPFLLARGDVLAICLLSAVAFLHSKKILHRDIRPEKILLNDALEPILVDLGQAAHLGDSVAMMRRLGTAGYVAPEVLDTRSPGYGSLSDVFSVGCVMFLLYSGIEAFRDINSGATLQRTMAGKARFNHPKAKQVRSGTQHLLRKMLAPSPKKRPKAHKSCKALFNLGDEEVRESPSALKAIESLPEQETDSGSFARLQPVQEFREDYEAEEMDETEMGDSSLSPAACVQMRHSAATFKSMPPGFVPSVMQEGGKGN